MLKFLESGPGLSIVKRLQARRSHSKDMIARFLHYAGHPVSTGFALGFVALHKMQWKQLQHIHQLTALQVIAVQMVKYALKRPRPHLANPEQIQGLVRQNGYGIPSGHAMAALVYGWLWAADYEAITIEMLVAIYVLISAWARVYLGVHYPQDVVVGVMLGYILWTIYWQKIEPLLDYHLSSALDLNFPDGFTR